MFFTWYVRRQNMSILYESMSCSWTHLDRHSCQFVRYISLAEWSLPRQQTWIWGSRPLSGVDGLPRSKGRSGRVALPSRAQTSASGF